MGKQGQIGASIFSMLVLFGTAVFMLYAYKTQKTPGTASYELSARFVSATGLARGADVDMAGVRVGRVSSVTLDTQTQMAIVRFRVDTALRLPRDSLLSIGSATLSSDSALMIEPGSATEFAAPGTLLTHTTEPTSLEQQVSNYIFGVSTLEQ
ncbi:MlaD family protein [Acetobacter sp. TBRC 12305]|uniref:MCE family protein n=1 Tax=Acetobacter garciniae TaxID=2817435 RepID=A0A939HNC3_9PROT|nr:MlaD family protein [Acetobacter garciniae]MBO1324124.1 MCE family protein [Acetobacter garciniae]MBX0343813.1 MlaD family protein [Acetobacter garciniae]